MIESLTGIMQGTAPHGLYLSCGPVTWELLASTRSIRSLAGHAGREVLVYTHLVVREDDLKLYAFSDKRERELFRSLIGVSGIGARQAIKILSFSAPLELVRLIEGADIDALGRIPGIGRKTAQKMVLSLQGELVTDSGTPEQTDVFAEIVESLVSMGFEKSSVRKTVESCAAAREADDMPPRVREQEIFRSALLELSTREQGG